MTKPHKLYCIPTPVRQKDITAPALKMRSQEQVKCNCLPKLSHKTDDRAADSKLFVLSLGQDFNS